jgi:hypothetical protein
MMRRKRGLILRGMCCFLGSKCLGGFMCSNFMMDIEGRKRIQI